MNTDAAPPISPASLERILARLLRFGTYLACVVIAVGLALSLAANSAGAGTATAGIVLFIALPVARVVTMLAYYLRDRDYRFSAIAALVLMIIVSSYLIGAR